MARRGRSHQQNHEVGQELNLVPYMDIMVNLVLFMLVNIVSFLSFTILNASIPQLNTNPSKAQAQAQGEELLLVLRVNPNGFLVEPTVTGGSPIAKKSIPKVVDETTKKKVFDVATLNGFLVDLKKRFPKEAKILIISQSDIEYENIIHTMDAVRETTPGTEDLFPEVTLSI
ncbi:MAG: biopolymer transporter ExbD [Bdellovibrionales bacterium]|nr:biopolymer transporter ExbD [Bdellovibrionales bacterium]